MSVYLILEEVYFKTHRKPRVNQKYTDLAFFQFSTLDLHATNFSRF